MLVRRRHSRLIPDGATIFEADGRQYARWRTPAGEMKTRPLNRKGDRIVEESPCWYVRLRDPETGKLKEWKAFTDRQASQAREVEILRQMERQEVGLADAMTRQRKRPLEEHLRAFEEHLAGKGNTPDHVEKTLARCRRIVNEIEARTLRDLTEEAIDECLSKWRRTGMSVSTSNGYFRAIRTFCRWLVRTKRTRENPVAGMSCMRVTDADRKRRRRALGNAELSALVEAARRSPEPFMGLSGPDRALLYIVAANTGLRAGELATLTPESFRFDNGQPLVRCLAGYTKNGQEAVQPLRRDVAATIAAWLENKPAGQPVWPGQWASQRHGAEMIRIDLTAADVEYEDDDERVADFHALRHTFISNLARAGVHPRNAQALARHSTIDLTMNAYTHVEMGDLARDVEQLPSMPGSGAEPTAAEEQDATAEAAIPAELTTLAGNWDALPHHIRQAIVSLAGASRTGRPTRIGRAVRRVPDEPSDARTLNSTPHQ